MRTMTRRWTSEVIENIFVVYTSSLLLFVYWAAAFAKIVLIKCCNYGVSRTSFAAFYYSGSKYIIPIGIITFVLWKWLTQTVVRVPNLLSC
jgi:ABC-type multidrug transport system permease subunit